MNPEQQKSILTIALLAAFADGSKDDRERERIRPLAESLANEAGAPDLARLYQDVMLAPALGCRVQLASGYDTDLLGTFTREIPSAKMSCA